LKKNPKIGFGTRIGISYGTYNWFWSSSPLTTLPVEAYFSYGTKSCLELGLGYTSMFEEDYYESAITLRASYKYRGPKGTIFAVGVLAFGDSYGMAFPLPHLSIGFSFKKLNNKQNEKLCKIPAGFVPGTAVLYDRVPYFV
jgi:hypothetical protein